MKIAFVYSGYSTYAKSGVTVQVDRMIEFFKKRGHEVYLYSQKEIKWLPFFLAIFFRTIIKPVLGKKFKQWLWNIHPDVVIIQGVYLPESRLFAFFKKEGWKLIIIQHGFPDLFWMRPIARFYFKVVGKRILEKADKIVVISNYTYKKILPFAEQSKIIIIPLGIDFKNFYPLPENAKEKIRKCFQIKDPLVLGVGRFVFLKNFKVLIKAIKFIPRAQLFLVGSGFKSKKLEILTIILGVRNRVRFFKYIPLEKLRELYNIADITILPSLAEGLGLVLIESLACGTPVIGSRLGGVTDIIEEGKNGFFLENPCNEKELARHISRILRDKELYKRMVAYARKSVEKKFDRDKLLLKLEETIKNAIEEKI